MMSPPYIVLIVDDAPEDRETYRRYLLRDQSDQYQIVEADSLEAAWEACDRQLPNLILLNDFLPDGKGLDFLETWKNRYSQISIPVILLTGQGNEQIAITALKNGAQDYCVKGQLTADSLRQIVQTTLQQIHLKQQLLNQQEQQQLINRISLQIRQSLQLQTVLQSTVTEIRQFLQADRVIIYQFAPDRSGKIVAESVLPGWIACLDHQIVDTCFQQGYSERYLQSRIWAVNDIQTAELTKCHQELLESFQVKANLVVPISVSGESENSNDLWGLLIAHQCDQPRQWQALELELMSQLAVQIAIAIQHAETYERLQTELAERRQTEQILRDTEARYRLLFESSPQPMWVFDLETLAFVDVNEAAIIKYGYSKAEFLSMTSLDIRPPEDIPLLLENVRQMTDGFNIHGIWRHRLKNNQLIFVEISSYVLNLNNRKVGLILSEDVTARVQTEEILRDSEERFRGIFEQAAVGICYSALDGQFLRVNQRFCEIVGYSEAELLNLTFREITHPDDLALDLAQIPPLLKGEIQTYSLEKRYIHKDQSLVWVNLTVSLMFESTGVPKALIGVIEDITSRKQAEAALRQSESKHRALIHALPDLIMRMSGDGIYLDFFPTDTFQVFGDREAALRDHNLVGTGIYDGSLPQDLAAKRMGYIQQALQTETVQTYEQEILVNGALLTEEVRITACGDNEVLIIVRDVTERKRIEDALRRSEAINQAIIQAIPDLLIRTNAQGEYLQMLSGGEVHVLYPPPESFNVSSVLPKPLADQRMQAIRQALATQTLQTYEQQLGSDPVYWEEVRIVPVNDEEVLVIVRDVTARVQAEAALRQSEATNRAIIQAFPDHLHRLEVASGQMNILSYGRLKVILPPLGIAYPSLFNVLPYNWIQRRLEVAQQVLNTKEIQTYEQQLEIQGETRYEEVCIAPFNETEVLVIIRDITDRKAAEQSVIASEQRFRATFEQAAVGIAHVSLEGHFLRVNQKLSEILGYSVPELMELQVESLSHPEDLRLDLQKLEKLVAGEISTYSLEKRYIRKDGSLVWGNLTVSLVYSCSGAVPYLVEIVEEITTRKQAEAELQRLTQELEERVEQRTAALRESEERWQLAIQGSNDGIWDWNLQTNEVFFSSRWKEMLGFEDWEIPNHLDEWAKRVYPDDLDVVMEAIQDHLDGKTPFYITEHRVLCKDGSYKWILDRGQALWNETGTPIRMTGSHSDITERKQAEQRLQEKTTELEQFFSTALDLLCIADTAGYFRRVNPQWEVVLGYPMSELEGRRFLELVHPDDVEPTLAAFGELVAQRQISSFVNRYRCQDGSYRWIEWRSSPSGHLIYAAARDITQRMQMEAELQKREAHLSVAQHIAGLGSWEFDVLTGDAIWSKELFKIWGRNPEDLAPSYPEYLESVYAEDRDRVTQVFETVIAQGTSYDLEYRLQRGDELRHLQQRAEPILDNNQRVVRLVGTVLDITERKQTEEQLRRFNEQLTLSNAELDRATRLKDEFLANMSHELRTPLNAILGMAEGLQDNVFGELSDRQRRSVETIERSGKHLLELINDILDLSKIESGKLELNTDSVSVHYLCESSLTFIRQPALKKHLQLISDIPAHLPDIQVDERRIRQVLINLLSNAIKFTPEGGSVKLVVHTEQEADQQYLCFSVIDTGIGIAPEHTNLLFQPFVQIDSRLNRQYAGTGLGLALVKQLIDLHHGKITVTSELGVGSRFTVYLPYLEGKATLVSPVTPLNLCLTPQSQILIIEDSLTAAEQVARYVRELGIQSQIHHQGEGAVEVAIQLQPALIVLDVLLPRLSGWEVLQQLKAHPQTQHIPVLAISVLDERSRGLALGADEYLLKPLTREQFQRTLERFYSKEIQSAISLTPHSTTLHTRPSSPPLLLLAEDNEANIATLSSYLPGRGYQLILAQNGQEAVELAQQHHPDLILMDIQMPEMDGLEAIRQIRANPDLVTTPIIALTALAMPGDREQCLAVGANDYFSKPMKLKQLIEKIQTLLHP